MRKHKITIFSGRTIWENGMEYTDETPSFFGSPYHKVTEVDGLYYFWELDLDDPGSGNYKIVKTSNDSSELTEEGNRLYFKIFDIYKKYQLFYKRGQTVLDGVKAGLGKQVYSKGFIKKSNKLKTKA